MGHLHSNRTAAKLTLCICWHDDALTAMENKSVGHRCAHKGEHCCIIMFLLSQHWLCLTTVFERGCPHILTLLILKSCIVMRAQILVTKHGGLVPQTFEELEALPGVGHKTASVVMVQAFG